MGVFTRCWRRVSLSILLLLAHPPNDTCVNLAFAEELMDYIDDETGQAESFDPGQQLSVKFINKSTYRADIHWDDGNWGKNVAIVEARGGDAIIQTYFGHQFYVTMHGVGAGLYDPDTDDQYRFEVAKPGQTFVIPEGARPSSDPCKDRFAACAREAARGTCHQSPGWMIVHCCESCDKDLNSRELIDPNVRCTREKLNMTHTRSWGPGDLNRLFTSWATDERFSEFEPHVLSSPDGSHGGESGPWVMVFDNFLSSDEADALIRGGNMVGFERSTDQGSVNELGEREKLVSMTRTSSNAWCVRQCEELPEVKRVTARIEDVTGIDRDHYESFQILEYGLNQFYRMHHDSSDGKKLQPDGPRILTFFLYLSDVEEGGETHFNKLDISVKPKKGRALVWPSVKDEDPDRMDPRMYHEAKNVIRGKKYAANHWIHLYDYVTPNHWGCTGSFM